MNALVPATRRRALASRLRSDRGILADVAIFVVASVACYVAQEAFTRPTSAALVYLVGVIVIGARSGLASGLAAAITASIVFNFFQGNPLYGLHADTVDALVRLTVFCLSAVVTGALAGRLKDSARQARAAEARSAFLLRLSDRLHQAITVADVARLARETLPFNRVHDLDIYVKRDEEFVPADEGCGRMSMPGAAAAAYPMRGSDGEIGGVCFTLAGCGVRTADADAEGIANIMGLAVERCLAFERLAESREVQRSEQLKTALLSSVSHDLRNPLTAIDAAASSLCSYEDVLSRRQKAALLHTIREQCSRLNRYTANLLGAGRMEAGASARRFERVDVVEILGVALTAARDAHPGQRFDKQVLPASAVVEADPAMLEQLIGNLIDNAVVHGASERPITIRVAADEVECVLEVIDFGPGIASDEQRLVFDRFYRSPASRAAGTGLGLHIARGFAEAFGGEIALVSPFRDGIGTCMSLRLPLTADWHARVGSWE